MSHTDQLIRTADSWPTFFATTCNLPSKTEQGIVFERLTELYLRVQPEYETRLSDVWKLRDVPPAVRQELRLGKLDEGIDLIARTRSGEYWAIQCKFRSDTDHRLTRRELATFTSLAFHTCKGISLAVVAHTCARPVKKHELLPHTVEIGLDRWLELQPEDWQRIQLLVVGKESRPTPRNARPHQLAAVSAAKQHFISSSSTRGRLIMPCGTGKSLTAFWIAQALNPKSILVVVPSLSLIRQSLTDWTREFVAHGEMPDWLCVCSDVSAGRLEHDEFVESVYELGVNATTNVEEIADFLRRRTHTRKIIFATYQSGAAVAAGARAAAVAIDFGVFDEAHRTVGAKEKSFAQLLSDHAIQVRQRMFMTATERIVRGAGEDILSMDNVSLYGERFYRMSFKAAIAADPPIICEYKILTVAVSNQNIEELIENNRYLSLPDSGLGEREAQSLAAGLALDRAFKETGVRHAISFHRSIRAAEEFRDQHEKIVREESAEIRPACSHISSRKTAGERAELMRAFEESEAAVITNARCLQEGVDIPAVDCVLFADPKRSVVDIVQAAGRAMRPYPGKKVGYIVVPVIVPQGEDFAQFAVSTEFREVARVITALSTEDDRIAEEFRAIFAGKRTTGQIVEITGDVPIGYKLSLDDLRENIRVCLWNSVGRANWRLFGEARAFVHTLGLKNKRGWDDYCRKGAKPPDIPTDPYVVYWENGWAGWGDWVGTGFVSTRLRTHRPFLEARAFVRDLGLRSDTEWKAYSKSDRKPADIPADPSKVYGGKGWAGMGDWIGTGAVAPRLKEYRAFEEAREYARSLGFKSQSEWFAYSKSDAKPDDIPANPNQTYHDEGWVSMGDWLGTGVVATFHRRYRPFSEARSFVRSLNLQSKADWQKYCGGGTKPADIPTAPSHTYAHGGWAGWGDWLGTGTIAPFLRKYRPFAEARKFARALGLRSQSEWIEYCHSGKKPHDIPASPNYVYRDDGWVGVADWLGSVRTVTLRPRSFEEARIFARSLKLTSPRQWTEFARSNDLPGDIPRSPDTVYRSKGWISWPDWLGTAHLQRQYRSFEEARKFVRSLNLQSGKEWFAYCRSGKVPVDIPGDPSQTYRNRGWAGMGDWLGTGFVATHKRQFRPFEEARTFARSLRLRSRSEWERYCKSGQRPCDIPTNPQTVYRERGWVGLGDWLGTGTLATWRRRYRPFLEARAFVRSLGLKSQKEWSQYCKSGKKPDDIPRDAHVTYRDKGWNGIADWLGTGRMKPRGARAFAEARRYARSSRVRSAKEWRNLAKSGRLPSDIPRAPDLAYEGKGWVSWADWLGVRGPRCLGVRAHRLRGERLL